MQTKEYTYAPTRRAEAIALAQHIAEEGRESTVHCGTSHFGASPYYDWVTEYNSATQTWTRHPYAPPA